MAYHPVFNAALADGRGRERGLTRAVRLGPVQLPPEIHALRRSVGGLKSVSGLGELPVLNELRVSRTALRCEDLLAAGLPPTLQTMAFYTGKAGPDREIRKQLEQRGFAEMPARQ